MLAALLQKIWFRAGTSARVGGAVSGGTHLETIESPFPSMSQLSLPLSLRLPLRTQLGPQPHHAIALLRPVHSAR
jgi:hypothetical protein